MNDLPYENMYYHIQIANRTRYIVYIYSHLEYGKFIVLKRHISVQLAKEIISSDMSIQRAIEVSGTSKRLLDDTIDTINKLYIKRDEFDLLP